MACDVGVKVMEHIKNNMNADNAIGFRRPGNGQDRSLCLNTRLDNCSKQDWLGLTTHNSKTLADLLNVSKQV